VQDVWRRCEQEQPRGILWYHLSIHATMEGTLKMAATPFYRIDNDASFLLFAERNQRFGIDTFGRRKSYQERSCKGKESMYSDFFHSWTVGAL
jgi:hypothetical protein